MTPEDTNKIIAAIDRLRVSIYNQLDWIFAAILLAGMMSGCPRMVATPLLSPLDQPIVEIGTPPLPPLNPNLQYWHTQWVPGPDGVLPVEVFTPRLVTQVASDAAKVEVPEPGTLKTYLLLGMLIMWLLSLRAYLDKQSHVEKMRNALLHVASCSRDEDSRAVARKALEG